VEAMLIIFIPPHFRGRESISIKKSWARRLFKIMGLWTLLKGSNS